MGMIQVRSFKNIAGGSSETEWSNTYCISTTSGLSSDETRQDIQTLLTMEKNFHLNNTIFTRQSCVNLEIPVGQAGRKKTFSFGGVGSIAQPDTEGNHNLPNEYCVHLVFENDGARPGGVLLRNAVPGDGWKKSGVGAEMTGLRLNNVIDLASQMSTAATNGTIDLQVVSKVGGQSFHSVTNVSYAGLVPRDQKAYRKKNDSTPQTEQGVLQRLLSGAAEIALAAAVLVATKGKGAPIVRSGAIAAVIDGIADTVSTITTSLAPPVQQ